MSYRLLPLAALLAALTATASGQVMPDSLGGQIYETVEVPPVLIGGLADAPDE